MRKYAVPFFLILSAFAIIAVFAYNYFEIYEQPIDKKPSRQARANEYLAMEQWLTKTGHAVRIISSANISNLLSAPEKVAVIFASLFDWKPDAYNELEQWAENGGNLILCLGDEVIEAEKPGLEEFFSKFGFHVNYNEYELIENNDAFPAFSNDINFTISNQLLQPRGKDTVTNTGTNIITIADPSGKIRLIRLPIKKGSITFCGTPDFMKSRSLDKEKNALLSWYLTGEQDIEKKGILFVRGAKIEPGFFGRLAERGNFTPLLVSILVLLAAGFWMSIPVFGFLKGDEERPGKPIRERFLAEARFLKKYKSLASYLETYYLFIKKRFAQQYGENINDDHSFFSRLADICDIERQDIAEAFHPLQNIHREKQINTNSANTVKERWILRLLNWNILQSKHLTKIPSRKFIKQINTIKTILERL